MPAKPATRGDATRNELKRAARRLFAERGIAAVGMRDILDAAGQRNAAAVHYYFGGKDELLSELVVDGARAIDRSRRALLDAAEAKEGGPTLDDIVRAMVLPNIDIQGETGESETYLRFIGNLQAERRALFEDAAGTESLAYARCLDQVRRLLAHLPLAVVNQRLLFAGLSSQAILAAREAALDGADERAHPYWTRPGALDAIILAIEGILIGPSPAA
ncbi:TetR/AcrR family transcriptional regulator [Sphingomonas sp.]|jgi:AcrR family transcriptional regulator|uniref:TetR/AcrR family transcriptional regulator n=1 Tax=Sphingomonas sp. TaxID=28214 RepID=UPI0035C8248B